MNQPPAFQFYPDDFIGGTVDLSADDCGAYIRLICYQWGRGRIPSDRVAIARVCGCQPSEEVLAKFPEGKNKRLEREREKQIEFRKKQANSGKVGAAKRWGRHGNPIVSPMANHSSPVSNLQSPIVERERLPEIPPMSRKDFDALADMRGVPKDCTEWFWNTNDARNWLDSHGQPIRKVEPLLMNALKSWRVNQKSNGGPSTTQQPSVYSLTKIIEAKKAQADGLRSRWAVETGLDTTWSDDKARQDHRKLKSEIKQLTAQLSGMA